METVSVAEIKKRYENGERNFDEIRCEYADFTRIDLRVASFKKSNLNWGFFDNADLTNTDFSESNLEWSSFRRATLRNTDFTRANASFSDFSNAIAENTNFTKANLTASLFFNVNMGATKLEGANLSWAAMNIGDLSPEGLQFVLERLKIMGAKIPQELLIKIQSIVKGTHERGEIIKGMKTSYTAGGELFGVGYGQSITGGCETALQALGMAYTAARGQFTDAYHTSINKEKQKETYQ